MRPLPSFPLRHRRKSDDGFSPAVHASAPLVKSSHAILEIKADDSAPGVIHGYGSVFGAVDSYNEAVKKGAFRESLRRWKREKAPIPMLWQHRSDQPCGGWTEFEEDDHGLRLVGQIDLEIPEGQRAWSGIRNKYLRGLSIGYFEIEADPYAWESGGSDGPRELRKLDLREVSVVTFPALREAQIDAVKHRQARGERITMREFEIVLREQYGFSRSEAEHIARSGYKSFLSRDASGSGGDERIVQLTESLAGLELPPL